MKTMARRATPIIAVAAASAAIVVTMLVIHGARKRKSRQTHEKASVASSRSGSEAVLGEREQSAIRDEEAADISTTRDNADIMAIGPSMGSGDVEQLGDDDVEEEASAPASCKARVEEDPFEPQKLQGVEIVHQDALAVFAPTSEENPIEFQESVNVPSAKSTDENTDPLNTNSHCQESFEQLYHLELEPSSIEPIAGFVPDIEHEVKNTTIVMDIDTSNADESEEETQFPVIILTSSIHEETKTSESCQSSKSSDGEGVFSKEVDMNATSNFMKSYDATSAIDFENTATNGAYVDTSSSSNRDVCGESKIEEATTRANNTSNDSITLAEINIFTVNVNGSTPSKEECISDDTNNVVYRVPSPHDITERKEVSPPIMNSSSPADEEPQNDGVIGDETREGQQCPKRSLQKEHRQHSSSTLASVTSSEAHNHHHHHFHPSLSKLVPHPSHLKEHLRHSLRVFKHHADDDSKSHDGSISSTTAKNNKHISIKKKKNSKRELHLGSLLVKSASLYSVTPDLCPKPSQHAIHF